MFINKTLLFVVTYPWSIYVVLSMDLRNVNSKSIGKKQNSFKTIYEANECEEIFNDYQCSYINKSIQNYIKRLEFKFHLSNERFENEYDELHQRHDKYLKTNHARKAKSNRLIDYNIENKEIKKSYKHTNVHHAKAGDGSLNNIDHFVDDDHWTKYLYDWHPVIGVNRNKAHAINPSLLRRTPAKNNFTPQRRQDSGTVINQLSFSESLLGVASFLNVVNSVRQEVTIENISDDIMFLSSIIENLAVEVTSLASRVNAVETVSLKTSILATENKQRHSNADSALRNICSLIDQLFYGTSPKRQCCYEEHTNTQIGNFMLCLADSQADILFDGDAGEGVCASSCGGLAPNG